MREFKTIKLVVEHEEDQKREGSTLEELNHLYEHGWVPYSETPVAGIANSNGCYFQPYVVITLARGSDNVGSKFPDLP